MIRLMIVGFFLIEIPLNFVKFEIYLKEMFSYLSTKKEFFTFLDTTNYEIGEYKFENVVIEIIELDEKSRLGWISPAVKPLHDHLKERMIEIGQGVNQGDKMTIHRILQANSPSDLLF